MENRPENIEAAEKLVKRYRAITLEEIEETYKKHEEIGKHVACVPNTLTGFGQTNTCTLCYAIDFDCNKCIYKEKKGCIINENQKTYEAINVSITPEKLKIAFDARADHINEILKKWKK